MSKSDFILNGAMPANAVTIEPSINAMRQAEASGCGIPENTVYKGVTKREYFAGLAMQGYISNSTNKDVTNISIKSMVEVADALLKELEK